MHKVSCYIMSIDYLILLVSLQMYISIFAVQLSYSLIGASLSDLQNLYVHVCTSNSNLILKMIMEFSRSSSTTVDLLGARERLCLFFIFIFLWKQVYATAKVTRR